MTTMRSMAMARRATKTTMMAMTMTMTMTMVATTTMMATVQRKVEDPMEGGRGVVLPQYCGGIY
jgi:hypothetical protein